jgi:hypothetical protein
MNTTAPRYASAVCRARDLITELQIQDPSEIVIEKIAPFKGAPIRYAELVGCDGRMVRTDSAALITVRQSVARIGQRRFIIAHELGHVLLHPSICQMDKVDLAQIRNFNHRQNPQELEANYFAAELLMPKRFFEPDARKLEPSWGSMRELAERYQTTLSSTAIQYVHSTREPVFLVASEAGERKWFVISESAKDFYLTDVLRVHSYTCVHELLAENKNWSRASDVPAGAWFSGFDADSKEFITEDAMRATGSEFVLSLLWIHEAI